MSVEFDALKSAFENYKADVTTQVGNLQTAVRNLTAQVTTDSTDSAAIQALTAEITAAQASLDAAVNPPSPTPTPSAPATPVAGS